jgi:hypothetical protein
MGFLLLPLKLFGWQYLLRKTWSIVYPDLRKYAARSDTKLDDGTLEMINEMIDIVTIKKK